MSKSATIKQPDELAFGSLQTGARLKQVMPGGTDMPERML